MEHMIAWLFTLLMLFGTGVILVARNVIHAVYALAIVLVSLAGIYVFLHAELLTVVQILLYAGGVVILLVFGVMMTNRDGDQKLLVKHNNVLFSALISIAVLVILMYLIEGQSFEFNPSADSGDQVRQIGISFLTDHIVGFELIAFILLVALVGASYLAKNASDD